MPRRIPLGVRVLARQLAEAGMSPTDILEVVERAYGTGLISKRAVQNIKKEVAIDPGEQWSMWEEPDADVRRLVTESLGELIVASEGHVVSLANEHARWIAKVRQTAPSMSAWMAYLTAGTYVFAEQSNMPAIARGCDVFVAVRPWESPQRGDAYRALKLGSTHMLPMIVDPTTDQPARNNRESAESDG